MQGFKKIKIRLRFIPKKQIYNVCYDINPNVILQKLKVFISKYEYLRSYPRKGKM